MILSPIHGANDHSKIHCHPHGDLVSFHWWSFECLSHGIEEKKLLHLSYLVFGLLVINITLVFSLFKTTPFSLHQS